jgi:uncharacterized protein (TIGR03435 family)
MRAIIFCTLAWCCAYGQATDAPSFEVASVKPASPTASAISCSGGPGTASPGIWRCSNVPLGFLISFAHGFEAYQFRPNDPCCRDRVDLTAKVPEGTTKKQFERMIQTLLEERFKLKLHYERKEMAIYELTVGEKGPKLKESAPDASSEPEFPWTSSPSTMGKDGYPVFPAGRAGLAGPNGHYRWTGFALSTQDIAKTLSEQLGRPVVDATGLKGKYDVDLKWVKDLNFELSERAKAEILEQVGDLPDTRSGPTLVRAIQDQLGLKLTSKTGPGDIVVLDHLEKVPTDN